MNNAISNISEDRIKTLESLNKAFLEENENLNLSAFRTKEQSWIGNILDSLSVLGAEIIKPGQKIMDLGTGGGFPLLPLAICFPQCSFTGIDSTSKKIAAVKLIAEKIGINNIILETGRSEELGREARHREAYDIVLSRAVAELNTLLEYCAPFCKIRGHIVLWKSLKIGEELKDSLAARTELSCHLVKKHVYDLPEKFGKRQILIFEKTCRTSDKYPRGIGIPKKNPII